MRALESGRTYFERRSPLFLFLLFSFSFSLFICPLMEANISRRSFKELLEQLLEWKVLVIPFSFLVLGNCGLLIFAFAFKTWVLVGLALIIGVCVSIPLNSLVSGLHLGFRGILILFSCLFAGNAVSIALLWGTIFKSSPETLIALLAYVSYLSILLAVLFIYDFLKISNFSDNSAIFSAAIEVMSFVRGLDPSNTLGRTYAFFVLAGFLFMAVFPPFDFITRFTGVRPLVAKSIPLFFFGVRFVLIHVPIILFTQFFSHQTPDLVILSAILSIVLELQPIYSSSIRGRVSVRTN